MKTKWISLLMCIIICIGCSSDQEGEWKGVIENESGIEMVHNPETPMYSSQVVTFKEDMIIGQSHSDEEFDLSSILSFAVDDQENVFVMDTKPLRIKVFNRHGKFLRSFGREGEGPGDLTFSRSMQYTYQHEIMCIDDKKGEIKFYSSEGRFLRYLKCPILRWSSHTTMISSGRIYSVKRYPGGEQEQLIFLIPPYEDSKIIASRPAPFRSPIPLIWIRYALLPEDHMVWGMTSEYAFHVIDNSGRMIRKIRKKHTPIALSEEYKSEISQLAPPGWSKEKYAKQIAERLSSHFPAFDFIFTDEAGNLFVKTFETEKETGRYLIDIFDTQGRFVARTALKVCHVVTEEWPNLYQVKNNHLYAPDYNEDRFPVLKRYEIIWNIPSPRNGI